MIAFAHQGLIFFHQFFGLNSGAVFVGGDTA
jgi:hypothetical protein